MPTLIEPFAGSAAITLAAAGRQLASAYVINDANPPLIELWREIIAHPGRLADEYERLWRQQHADRTGFYNQVRTDFNRTPRPELFLFLLARCVKAAVRYNARGDFNQSSDRRRSGTLPATMRGQLLAASGLLRGRVHCESLDYRETLARATPRDLVYLDPPYQGVSHQHDPRYIRGTSYQEFVLALEQLNRRKISYLVSYDGRTGEKTYGENLPASLELTQVELPAGRSSQSTLLGRVETTVESLYLSPALRARTGQSVLGSPARVGA